MLLVAHTDKLLFIVKAISSTFVQTQHKKYRSAIHILTFIITDKFIILTHVVPTETNSGKMIKPQVLTSKNFVQNKKLWNWY